MGIDEVLEVALSLQGEKVVIIHSNGQEIRGHLVGIDDFIMNLALDSSRTIQLSLGEVNWMTRG